MLRLRERYTHSWLWFLMLCCQRCLFSLWIQLLSPLNTVFDIGFVPAAVVASWLLNWVGHKSSRYGSGAASDLCRCTLHMEDARSQISFGWDLTLHVSTSTCFWLISRKMMTMLFCKTQSTRQESAPTPMCLVNFGKCTMTRHHLLPFCIAYSKLPLFPRLKNNLRDRKWAQI